MICIKKVIAIAATFVVMLLYPVNSGAHYQPGIHNIKHAINLYFCGKSTRTCAYGQQALRVSYCESRWSTRAENGQYRGLFQMGYSERKRFGHGPSPWAQAKAAHKYFVYSGRDWSPWTCKPTYGI